MTLAGGKPKEGEGVYGVVVHNGSTQPVYHVVAVNQTGADPLVSMWRVLSPGSRSEYGPVVDLDPRIIVSFMDSYGRGWTRNAQGVLRRDRRRWWRREAELPKAVQVGGKLPVERYFGDQG